MARITGTNQRDTLWGTGAADEIFGNNGDDMIKGGGGADRINGGLGHDTVTYVDSHVGVLVDLGTCRGYGGTAEGDILNAIESLNGSFYNDVLIGSAGDNGLSGLDGHDILKGGGGADRLDGGTGDDILSGGFGADVFFGDVGSDTADYSQAVYVPNGLGVAVVADLTNAFTTVYGEAAGDYFVAVENLTGSAYNDVLYGDDGVNVVRGLNGHDVLYGRAGDDVLEGGGSFDWLFGGYGNDRLEGGAGADRLEGNQGNDTFVFARGEAHGDTIVEFAGNGAAAGDSLQFAGYGPGASFTQVDATHWQVNYNGGASHEVITFLYSGAVHPTDVVFL